MYIAIGADAVIRKEEIIGIFDLDTVSQSYRTRESMKRWETDGAVTALGDDLPRSMVVCAAADRHTVWLSPLTSGALKRRWQSGRL